MLKAYAERSGYTVDTTTDVDEALYMAQRVAYDVLLLDVMMPGKDGFAICREVRKTSTVPILMITARGEDYNKIMGLDIGADDYIVKPFSPGEVMARIRAVLRRTEHTFEGKSHILTVSNLAINKETCVVTISGDTVALTKKEIDLLWMLASDAGPGVAEEELPYVFDRFYTSAGAANPQGTGLGLFIAKQITQRHHADIRMENQKESGCKITVVFQQYHPQRSERQ